MDKICEKIFATEILEHLTDPVSAIKEIRRVSKINADIIISVPFEPFFHWGNLLRGKYLRRFGRTPEHVNFWSRGEIKTLLSEFIEIEEEYYFSTFPWLLFHGRFKL
ncbi:MAG: methyltransferase domain-containing protein [Deltaproteobacteria bacterium]|nr:methyltransferase domain-containing protein [Deltaproteobacteria bacterium]